MCVYEREGGKGWAWDLCYPVLVEARVQHCRVKCLPSTSFRCLLGIKLRWSGVLS